MGLRQEMALNIAAALSKSCSEKITKQTIRYMQSFDTALNMDYLKNLWDDVCYQRQATESFSWSYYDDMILTFVVTQLKELNNYEVNAMWLQTDAIYDQIDDMQSEVVTTASEYSEANLLCYINDIARYVMNEYIYRQADSWRNDRLRLLLGYF
ncbi:MAG TPA: hypothetical protein DD294_02460 [Psychrobacter sp.]|jgi:hypothetical protein|nr:hypothetical protein [Psychrobacter sp.]